MEHRKRTNNKKIDNEHDKVVKELFKEEHEKVYILKKALNLNFKPDEIEIYTNSFVTSNYKYKEADCVYKLKGKNVFFVIEHQSVIDYRMPYRMSNYQLEVMRSCENYKNTKDNKEALVIGIVLYTGRPEWTAERYIRNIQYSFDDGVKTILGDNKTLGNYTIIDINKCAEEELLIAKSLISKVMLIEKARKTEDLGRTLIKMIKYLDAKGLKYIKNLIKNILVEDLGEEKAEEILEIYEKVIQGEGSEEEMELAISKTIHDEIVTREKRGEKRGERRGEKQGRMNVAKNLLTMGYSINQVGEITELSETEVKRLKKQIEATNKKEG